ncbi:MAG: hypothetical protein HQK56_16020 [Deltaproteobacteria bacterium]|nr:hypothetical protein [Deltaproteobacteria bacterium]
MRVKDIKRLWGSSGNRCAICRLEIASGGESSAIGEMAHIVARSNNGPRGESDLTLDERDQYDNLILLCPIDHAKIDTSPHEWSVEKLRTVKMEHEKWVSEQLDKKLILVTPVDNTKFIDERIDSWMKFSDKSVWVAVSITPLSLSGDFLNPTDKMCINVMNQQSIPELGHEKRISKVTPYYTRTNENGLINEDLRQEKNGEGYRIQIFRSGHCEFFLNLQGSVEKTTSDARDKDRTMGPEDRAIHYLDLAHTVEAGIDALYTIWKNLLPFKDMTLCVLVLNTSRSVLYSRYLGFGRNVKGYPVEPNKLCLKTVIALNDLPKQIFESVIKQLVTYFGLELKRVFDEKGDFIRPDRLSTST